MPYNPRTDTEEAFTKDTGLPGSALPPGPGYVLDPNGKVIVGDSTYYPSTTNGALDRFSRTIAVQNPTVAAKAAQDSPYSVVDQQLSVLQQRFKEQAEILRRKGLPAQQHNKILAGMQADYDTQKYKIADVKTQLDGIQSAIDSGIVDPEVGRHTQWQVAAPHMAAAMAPRPVAERQPKEALSPAVMAKQEKFMDSFATNAKVAKGAWWERDPESLIQKYKDYQDASNYNAFDAGQQKQLDLRWDELMKGTSAYDKWDPTDPRIKALRNYGGSQLLDVVNTKINGKRVTPFAQGVNSTPQNPTNLQPVVYAKNKQTGQRIQSVDGGKTWQTAR